MSKTYRVLVGCEFSGRVREAFKSKGWDAWSCDLEPTDQPGQHIQGDIFDAIANKGPWDMLIAFPPCTHLAASGAAWFAQKRADGRQAEGVKFFMDIVAAVEKIGCGAIENPVGIMSTQYRKPDQIIQPWQFGHGETKATCLWLYNLPKLEPTNIVEGRQQRVHRLPQNAQRAKLRSTTYAGVAEAMGGQWSKCANIPSLR